MMNLKLKGWARFWALTLAGAVIGAVVSLQQKLPLRTQIVYAPRVYQMPKMPGGTTLRMAMLHDVLLERYLHHGPAWYEQRIKDARATLAVPVKMDVVPPMARLDAMDDLAVALENLHRSEEAIAVMREKLALLPAVNVAAIDEKLSDEEKLEREIAAVKALTPMQHQQYTACANLGTSLIHSAFPKLLTGDAAARQQMLEGVGFIDKAIALNPSAHFGRETWQAIVVRHFLAGSQDKDMLTTFDIVGNPLSAVEPYARGSGDRSRPLFLPPKEAEAVERLMYRRGIAQTGVNKDWVQRVKPGIQDPVAFDEPALALMGMWMLGGGPNPHSALALADIARQIGQNEIAWDGYERALEMREKFSPDPAVRDKLVRHCMHRQEEIAGEESARDPGGWTARTRQRHQSELAWAQKYQEEYKVWEGKQIAAGVPLEDSHFYDGFYKDYPSIASPVGMADMTAIRIKDPDVISMALPTALLLAAGGGLLAAVTTRRRTADKSDAHAV